MNLEPHEINPGILDQGKLTPKVSIGIPVFNGGKTLARTIESILCQDYKNIEIIISDNASTDDTRVVSEKYQEKDSRILYFRQESNIGMFENFNEVFRLSSGEFFMWAAHDDEHASNFISSCLRYLFVDPNAALCAPITKAVLDGEINWTAGLNSFNNKKDLLKRYRETLRNFPAVAIYGIYRSSMVRKTRMWQKFMGADMVFVQELSLYGTFLAHNEILFTYYERGDWNTVDQDFANVYGKQKKPWYYSPFLIILFNQISIVVFCDHILSAKFRLLSVLFRFQFSKIVLKINLKMVKYLVPKRFKLFLANFIYWRFMHSPNIEVKNGLGYSHRNVRPMVGLRDE